MRLNSILIIYVTETRCQPIMSRLSVDSQVRKPLARRK